MARVARLLLVVVAALPVFGAALGGAEDKPRTIEYRDDRLTVDVDQMPIGALLEEIAKQSGAELVGGPREERQVTAQFRRLPMQVGLQRILTTQNFTLRYGDGGTLRMIELLGGPQTAKAPAAPTLPPPGQPPAGQCASALTTLQSAPPLPVAGRLAQALGSSTATYSQLLEAAMHQGDAGVRADALRTWLNGVESNAEYRTGMVGCLTGTDDSTITNMLRNAAGAHAEELVLQVATQARGSELRVKASTVLKQLRDTAGGS